MLDTHFQLLVSDWEHVQDARDMVVLICVHGELLQIIRDGDQPAAVPKVDEKLYSLCHFKQIQINQFIYLYIYHWN